MKIILDTDGTLTDFNRFIKENAIQYFIKKYNFKVINPDALEIQDIFDIKNVLTSEYKLTDTEAEEQIDKILNEFWISLRFVKFSLFTEFRPGVKEVINDFIKKGYDVQVHTSRAKTCENSIVGKIARQFTIWQYRKNGIFLSEDKFYFYSSDEEKLANIISINPDLVFDDKEEIINDLNQHNIKSICVKGNHNKNVEKNANVEIIDSFSNKEIEDKMNLLFGTRKMDYYTREANSEKFYNHLRIFIPLILKYFHPIVLNEDNLIHTDESVIYAPNHRSTLDPIVITALIDKNIHWAALKRFFEAEDSIFNNSKNSFLCEITAKTFKTLEYFPIDRKSDNPNANNLESIRAMNNFLKINSTIGIFGEGTTRRPENQDFGHFDESFLLLAKRCNSWVQPITTLWLEDIDYDAKVIINFGKPFKINSMDIDEAMKYFLDIQKESLIQNKQLQESLINDSNDIKKLLKKYKK